MKAYNNKKEFQHNQLRNGKLKSMLKKKNVLINLIFIHNISF
jgi:hypothetical protein